MPKLYEIEEGSKIRAECFNGNGDKIGDMITFHHLDGMYSYCTVDELEKDNVVHLSGGTPLKQEGDYYVIDESETK